MFGLASTGFLFVDKTVAINMNKGHLNDPDSLLKELAPKSSELVGAGKFDAVRGVSC